MKSFSPWFHFSAGRISIHFLILLPLVLQKARWGLGFFGFLYVLFFFIGATNQLAEMLDKFVTCRKGTLCPKAWLLSLPNYTYVPIKCHKPFVLYIFSTFMVEECKNTPAVFVLQELSNWIFPCIPRSKIPHSEIFPFLDFILSMPADVLLFAVLLSEYK